MTRLPQLRPLLLAGAVSLIGAGQALAEAGAEFGYLIVDILPLNDGATLEQVYAYFEAVEPIFAEYDLVRSDDALEVVDVARGDVQAKVINLWATKDPKVAFDGIFTDPDYLQHVENRDSIFDLKNANVVVTRRNAADTPQITGVSHP